MRVLVACEFSGIVRDAFRARGHDAWSCDLLPCEGDPQWHIQDDVLKHLGDGWDLMIAHPPCTYLSRAGARWWKQPGRKELADQAAEFVFALRDALVGRVAIENPIGQLNWRWRYPDQTINPYDFGEPHSKATCLWLRGLPPLIPTHVPGGDWFSEKRPNFTPLIRSSVTRRKRLGIPQTGKLSGGLKSAITFPNIARAMAAQWG